ncbi:polynucleotide adenylyltransferase PcnB [Chitinimonas koreensis]|uniref:polynucleotide adenylyltransferase PcnB n=1 Tax=Chitinimonas koreensis TaxID=356302 RepID=UPI00040ED89C|nr:polynucleotide adenylyltransferase PcnB [Chitinimonas koreensis]QNM96158.1 polynucleotide adenylyltransferase PcnB [Chitinimonas koreensis]
MIRKLIGRVLKLKKRHGGGRVVIPAKRHGISRSQLPSFALKTTDRLQEAGFEAFIVGGAVRDLLLGKHPKDFDVATNATPEDVHKVFRRSRIIGRRFRLVHVLYGEEVVEVSTFRGSGEALTDESGRIIRDNTWGSQEDDAKRRDFTVNALFYDPAREEIIDYHGGVEDIEKKRLAMIGAPITRYREDPVRMLRAVRLAAKLGLAIESETRKPIRELAKLLENVPAARLFDEMLKLLFSGQSWACLMQLRDEGLHHGFFPLLDKMMKAPHGEAFLRTALENTDRRIREDKPVSAGYVFAALLWLEVLDNWDKRKAAGEKPMLALFSAIDEVEAVQEEKLAIPRRYGTAMKEIWTLQPRFEQRSGIKPFRLLEHPRFRAGYDFLCLRASVGECEQELADWWTAFQDADSQAREAMLLRPQAGDATKKRRRRRSGAKQGDASAADDGQ